MAQQEPNFKIPPAVAAKYPELQERYDAEPMEPAKAEVKKKALRPFSPMTQEENESIKVLLNDPITFNCPTRWRRVFGIKFSKWTIRYQPFETLVRLGREYAKLFFDEEDVAKFGLEEAKRLTVEQSKSFARIAAIAVTGTMPFAGLLRPILTEYFYQRMHPRLAVQLCQQLNTQGEYQDFIISIGLTRGRRLTEPAPIEEGKEG